MSKEKSAGSKKMDSKGMTTVDAQQPMGMYSQKDGNNTTEYLSRTDAKNSKDSSKVAAQQYKGRY